MQIVKDKKISFYYYPGENRRFSLKKIYFLSGVVLFLLAGLLAVSWFFSSQLLYTDLRKCPVDHYVYCGTPDEIGLEYEEITFNTIDDFIIPGWYIPSGKSEKTVLLIHGRGATRHEGMRYAKALHKSGFNLLAIDLRHRRQKKGILCSMGYHEQKDVYGAVSFLLKKKGSKSIGIMGFSMGAATSIIAMEKDKRIKAGIFVSGFHNLQVIVAENASKLYGLPEFPLLPIVMKIYEWRGNLNVDEVIPSDNISKISPRPVFIMHGTADHEVGVHHGDILFEKAKQPKLYWKAEGGGHTRLWQVDSEKAEGKVVGFFSKNL